MNRIRLVVLVVLLGLVSLLMLLMPLASAPSSEAYAADLPTAAEPAAPARAAPEPASDVEALFHTAVPKSESVMTAITAAKGHAEQENQKTVIVRLFKEAYARVAGIEAVHTIDYGSFVWLELAPSSFEKLRSAGVEFELRPDATLLRFQGYRFDTRVEQPSVPTRLTSVYAAGTPGLYVVQLLGPTKDEWLADLSANGLQILQYMAPHSYLVRMTPKEADAIEALDSVRWVGPYHPAYRITSDLLKRSGIIENVSVTIYDDGQVGGTVDSTIEAIEALGGKPVGQDKARADDPFVTVLVALPASALIPLAQLNDVVWLNFRAPMYPDADEMSDQIVAGNFNPLDPGYQAWLLSKGVNGNGVTVAVLDRGYDTGVDATAHPDVSGRTIMVSDSVGIPTDENGHGTHVGGIIAANASLGSTDASSFLIGLGVAPSATLVVRRRTHDSNSTQTRDAVTNGAVASNHSYVLHDASLGYEAVDREFDMLVRDADTTAGGAQPLIIVFAAGNCGRGPNDAPDGPCFGNTGLTQEPKNVILVGSTRNQRNVNGVPDASNIDTVSDFSSRGPAGDGRVAPHVVAPGGNIISTRSAQAPTSCVNIAIAAGAPITNPTYSVCSGTSMAAPHVTGAVALITEWWGPCNAGANPSPAMAKALLVNGAVDMGVADIPNGNEGWGRVNLDNVIDTDIGTMYFDQTTVFTATGQTWSAQYVPADPNRPVKVTLAWTDAPGPGGGGNPDTLGNDLDLTVVEAGTLYRGAGGGNAATAFANGFSVAGGSSDSIDNLENVFIQNPAGAYTVTVTASNIVSDGVPYNGDSTDQDFALVIQNAALAVNSTADTGDGDPGDGICDTGTITVSTGICTLRAAIEEANATCALDTISFNIPTDTDPGCDNGTGVCTIKPTMLVPPTPHPLPVITDTVVIDGYTQPGAAPATGATNAVLKIVLDGSLAGNGVNGLVLETDDSTIRGLAIHGFRVTNLAGYDFSQGNGIVVREGISNTITGNFIGTNVTGTGCVGNGGSGVLIGGLNRDADADNNTVGGTTPADRNIITCNGFQRDTSTSDPDDGTATGGDGVTIRANHEDSTFYSADSNTIVGNYIGIDVTGMMTLTAGTQTFATVVITHTGNTGNGVRIAGGSSNIVGGTTVGAPNFISGNELAGVRIEAVAFDHPPTLTRAANSNVVQGNYIGTDVNGTGDLGNLDVGVYIVGLVDDADSNQVGGTTAAARNLISGNGGNGVMILGGEADHNDVQGNYIGTNVNGTAAMPNDAGGINITDAMTNTIGGATAWARNLVSGNGGHGISIVNSPKTWYPFPDPGAFRGTGEASGNTIEGNYIGTDVNGNLAISNTLNGVLITDAADNVVKDNLISGNGENGILIMAAGTPGNVETDVVTAEGAFGSGSDGATVNITDQPGALQVTKTVTPTTVAAAGNVVTFTIRITNTSGVTVTIKRLSDSIHGNLNGRGACAVPQTLVNVASYTCEFSAAVFGFGPAGKSETDTVTASGTDANGNFVIDSDSATVNIGGAPSIRVTKTASPTSLAPPGGTVNFTVTVKNIRVSGSVTITKTWDTKHGKLIPNGLCPVSQVTLNPGDTLQCTYSDPVSGATGNVIEGNYIGTDVNGTQAISNTLSGVLITNAPDNAVGGVPDTKGNLISGNAREGVVILGASATGNNLHNNWIGTQADGTSDLGNGSHGVKIAADASDNAIGSSAGVSNTIAYNGGDGVFVLSGTGNQILSNSIFDNDELGIDLGDDNAVTPNDDTDPDAGANNLQNYPVLTSASSNGSTAIGGLLNSTPNTTFSIQFFANEECDDSGFGEGQTYLGSDDVLTEGDGNKLFAVSLPTSVPTDHFITATATDPNGNTSEFSNCIPVPSSPVLGINKEWQDLNGGDPLPGDTLLYTINYSNTGNAPATGVIITDTYSVSCTTISNVTTDLNFTTFFSDTTRIRWPAATGGILLDAQASGSVSYRCTLDDSFPDGTTDVENTATIESDQPTSAQDTETVQVTVAPVLTIDKECTPATGNSPGDTVHCVIQYANTGDAYATDVGITDDYDESKGAVSNITGSAHFAAGHLESADDIIRWGGHSTIPAGESGHVEYDYDLAGPGIFDDGTTWVQNDVYFYCNEINVVLDEERIQVTAAAVLTIDKQVIDENGGLAEPTDVLSYTINYANTGDADATGVFITDDYSDLCANINVTDDGDFPDHDDNTDRIRWPNAGGINLAAGAGGSVSYACTLQDPFPPGTTRVSNTGTIDSNETDLEEDTETLFTVCYDFNGNGVVDVGDIMQVAARWCLTTGDPNWDDKYDVNGDGVITVVDIMMVAAQWGQTCP